MINLDQHEEAQSVAAAIERACRELPPGSATEQLRNFCGRGWEMLHTPEFARTYRLLVAEMPASQEASQFFAQRIGGPLLDVLSGIISRGLIRSELKVEQPHVAARVILAALIQQAYWCNHDELSSTMGCGCNRIVTDTLSLVLGGMACT